MADGDFVCCGSSYDNNRSYDPSNDLLTCKLSPEGGARWVHIYDLANTSEIGPSIIETDNGDFLIGCTIGDTFERQVSAARISEDGELLWSNSYGGKDCDAVIELKNDNFLLAGRSYPERNIQGYLVCIDGEGELLWSREYGDEASDVFSVMCETEGGVLLGGFTRVSRQPAQVWLLKVDPEQEGEPIWFRTYDFGFSLWCGGLVSDGHNGFIVAGSDAISGDSFIFKINNVGDLVWQNWFDMDGQYPGGGLREDMRGLARIDDDQGYCVVGSGAVNPTTCAMSLRVDTEGNFIWQQTLRLLNGNALAQSGYRSVVTGRDGSIISVGTIDSDTSGRNGIVVKLLPEISAPLITGFTPPQREFTVLLHDTIDFAVEVMDVQNDTLSFLWSLSDDSLAHADTACSVSFDFLGDYHVTCTVSDRLFSTLVAWLVHVKEIFIRQFTPPNQNLTFRCNSIVPFALDVACVEPNAWWTRWTMGAPGQAWLI